VRRLGAASFWATPPIESEDTKHVRCQRRSRVMIDNGHAEQAERPAAAPADLSCGWRSYSIGANGIGPQLIVWQAPRQARIALTVPPE
jgi:hypothetical protein